MNYSLKAGGKRLRPMLIMETAKLFKDDVTECLSFYGSDRNDSYLFFGT